MDKPTDRAWTDDQMKDDGFIPKYGLEFNINEDVMVYGVYSEGFRVGGVNRGLRGSGEVRLTLSSDSDLVRTPNSDSNRNSRTDAYYSTPFTTT